MINRNCQACRLTQSPATSLRFCILLPGQEIYGMTQRKISTKICDSCSLVLLIKHSYPITLLYSILDKLRSTYLLLNMDMDGYSGRLLRSSSRVHTCITVVVQRVGGHGVDHEMCVSILKCDEREKCGCEKICAKLFNLWGPMS